MSKRCIQCSCLHGCATTGDCWDCNSREVIEGLIKQRDRAEEKAQQAINRLNLTMARLHEIETAARRACASVESFSDAIRSSYGQGDQA